MKRKYTVIIERDESGWYISEVVELPGCHTQAKTIDELIERTKEAIALCLEERGDGDIKVSFVGLQKIGVEDGQIASN